MAAKKNALQIPKAGTNSSKIAEVTLVNPEDLKFNPRRLKPKQKNKLFITILLFLILVLAFQLGLFTLVYRTLNSGQVNFYILDANSKGPIAAASLNDQEIKLKTDDKGQASARLVSGEKKLVVTADNYVKKEVTLNVKWGQSQNLTILLDKLPEVNATIGGTVVDETTQKPLSKVTLKLVDSPVENQTISDNEGNFFLKVPAGKQKLEASLNGYQTQKQEIETSAGKTIFIKVNLAPS